MVFMKFRNSDLLIIYPCYLLGSQKFCNILKLQGSYLLIILPYSVIGQGRRCNYFIITLDLVPIYDFHTLGN